MCAALATLSLLIPTWWLDPEKIKHIPFLCKTKFLFFNWYKLNQIITERGITISAQKKTNGIERTRSS
jgi:hypothetical protein